MYISHQHQNQYPIFSRFVFVSSLFPLYILYISHQNTTLYTCHVLKMDCIPILRDSHQPLKIYIYIYLQIIKIRMGWMTITIIPCNLILTALIGTPRASCSQDERKRLRDHTWGGGAYAELTQLAQRTLQRSVEDSLDRWFHTSFVYESKRIHWDFIAMYICV